MEKYKNFLIILLISTIGGGAGVFFKIGITELPPDLFTFLRFFFALLAFLPFLFHKSDGVLVDKKKLILISLVGTANIVFFIYGLQYTTAIISGILYAAGPLLVGLFSWGIIKEKLSFHKWLGISVGFLGLLFIIFGPKLGVPSIWNGTLVGNLIVGFAVVSFSLYSVLSKKYQNFYSPLTLTKYLIFTTIFTQLVLMSFHLGSSLSFLSHISWKVWLIILYAGILDTTLYYFLYQYVVKRASPVIASMTFYLQPLMGVIWARFILNEKVTQTFFIGSALIFLGITLVFHEKYFNRPKVNT